jgi:hypothetical protein
MKRGGGMYGTIPADALPYAKRLEYVIDAVGETCGKPPTDFERTFMLQPLQAAIEWIQEGDPHGAAMVFFELGRRVERHYASAFDDYVKKALAWHKLGKVQAAVNNETKVKRAVELHAFIRQKYRAMEPQIRSGELRVSEAYYEIENMVARHFDDPNSDDRNKHVSFSTIDRALGKKDTKRKKK